MLKWFIKKYVLKEVQDLLDKQTDVLKATVELETLRSTGEVYRSLEKLIKVKVNPSFLNQVVLKS